MLTGLLQQVQKSLRGNAIGQALLSEAVRIVNGRGGDGTFFAEDHARTCHLYSKQGSSHS